MGPTALTEKQKSLAGEHIGVAKSLAKRYAKRYPRIADEIESAAMYGLVYSASRWTEDQNVFFLWKTRQIITTYIIEVFNKTNRESKRSAGKAIPTHDRADHRFKSPECCLERKENDREMEALISRLTARQQEVIRLIHEDGLRQSKAAERLGISRARVSEIYSEAMMAMRKMAGREN